MTESTDTAGRERDRRITDLGTLKALAHPLRMQLYRGLTVARVATASHLADRTGEAVSLVSYHLRKLAEHGLIEEAEPQSADGRERWWRPSSDGVSIRDEDFRDAPEKAAAHTAASRLFAEDRMDMYRRWLDERTHWGPEWNRSAESSESVLRLTADELAELNSEMLALLRRYEERGRAADAAEAAGTETGEGSESSRSRENVSVHTYSFPFRA
jgi:DNA-binding transcriptional ArsR family regulator